MKKVFLAGIAALAIAGSTVAYAQNRQWFHEHMRISPEDRAAALDRARTALTQRFDGASEIDVPMRASCWRADRTYRA